MKNSHVSFDKDHALHQLKHYLPAQAPLKDFIHHNTLHAFQDKFFHTGLTEAAQIFGYKVYLSLEEYQALFASGKINDDLLPSKNDSEVRCNPVDGAGFGLELDDQVGLHFEFSDDIDEDEQEVIKAAYEEEGMHWIIEGDHGWEIEGDAVVVLAPFKIDLYKDDETLIEKNVTLNT